MNNKIVFLVIIVLGLLFFSSYQARAEESVESDVLSYECISDADCNDHNSCTLDSCSKVPGRCLHAPLKGCHTRYGCVGQGSIGIQSDWPLYCSPDGDWLHMRTEGSLCSLDYECRSLDCQAGRCRGEPHEFRRPGFFRRLWWALQ